MRSRRFAARLLQRYQKLEAPYEFAGLSRGDAPDHFGAILFAPLRMERPRLASDALTDNASVAIYKNTHIEFVLGFRLIV